MTVHLQVPGTGMYSRNASVGRYASPGEAGDDYLGVEGKDYRWGKTSSQYSTARGI